MVRRLISPGAYIELIPNLIHLSYQENQGISFSLLADLPFIIRVPLLAGVSAVVVMGLIYYMIRHRALLSGGECWGLSLIIAGAIGNLLDRVFRQQVTDFMFFHFYDIGFFVNNLADDMISIGFVLLVLFSFLGRNRR